ncbi:MAG: hypothetical protein HKO57_05020 [Akkermansiaceae bacterium]|nr:hypothetical protein [Akkermansiaceae bacterium]
MTELPTTPFPELRPLDEKRRVPSLSDLLRGGPGFPAPAGPAGKPPGADLPVLPFGSADAAVVAAEAPRAAGAPTGRCAESLASLMDDERRDAAGSTLPPIADIVPGPAATDADLAAALAALLEPALDRAPAADSHAALHTYLEPMLRNTVRRAIAEQLQASSQFTEIGTLDRLAWRLRAIFSSRTYDEIVFERTRRYQVEEVYLVRKKDRGLISYAVHDPALHGAPRRIQPHLRRLTSRIREQDGSFETSLDLPEHRVGLVREGEHSLLLAVIRGRSNALVRADLDFIQRQIEDQFGSRIETRSDAFIHVLQPILEGALLIQSPAPPR